MLAWDGTIGPSRRPKAPTAPGATPSSGEEWEGSH